MARLLITSGPTRQYLDPVRFLTNASSGRMGASLAAAACRLGHEVVVVTGPVQVSYPAEARVVEVVSTEDMLAAAGENFETCDGLIGAAAPCDYRPVKVESNKIAKTGDPLLLKLVETPDIVAALASQKRPDQWVVGFALETEDHRFRALAKMERKSCDLMVVNDPSAIDAAENQVEIFDRQGQLLAALSGPKHEVAEAILALVQERLIASHE